MKTPGIPLFLAVLCIAITLASAKKIPLENFASFAAGGVGGGLSVLVGHPFDLVKVQLQTNAKNDGRKGTFSTLRDIALKDGLGGLYRGVTAPLIAVAPIFATSFWGFDVGDKLVRACFHVAPTTSLNLWQLAIAGGFSALPTALVMVPAERIKCLLQTQEQQQGIRGGGGTPQYNGFSDCAAQLYKEGGLGGLYKGTWLTLMRDVPGNMVYFGMYELVKNYLGNNPCASLVAGAVAGISFWPVVLPMDCLKSRYQTGSYRNMGEVYTELMKEEGASGLFRGIRPAMIRSAPANAISFTGAELTKKALSKFY